MPEPAVRPAACFAFRTPLLPFATYLDWSEGLASPSAWQDPEALEAALAADKARLRERLRALAARPEIREAIYLASPDLEESLERGSAEPELSAWAAYRRLLDWAARRGAGRRPPETARELSSRLSGLAPDA